MKQYPSIDTKYDPPFFSLDSTFKCFIPEKRQKAIQFITSFYPAFLHLTLNCFKVLYRNPGIS